MPWKFIIIVSARPKKIKRKIPQVWFADYNILGDNSWKFPEQLGEKWKSIFGSGELILKKMDWLHFHVVIRIRVILMIAVVNVLL